jgi:integrase
MASVERRNGAWRVRWRDPDGTPHSRQCPTKGAATKLKAEVEEAAALGKRWEPRDARPEPDLRPLLKDYAEECARVLKPNTAIRYARALDIFLRYLYKVHGKGAKLPPGLLTRKMLADFYADLAHGGLHGHDRCDATRRKIVEVIQLCWSWLYDNDEDGAEIPMPRKIRTAREPASPTVAPTWAEMDACIEALGGWAGSGRPFTRCWQRDVAVLLRFTGLRVQQAMSLKWSDLDLEHARLTIRGELGKSRQEQRGRIVPISPHLVAELRTWERNDEPWLVISARQRGGDRERMARARDSGRAWEGAGIRKEVWEGRPHHCFRKGFVSELKRAGADADAVEFLVGHSLGLRGVYLDPDALPLREAVNLIPALGERPARRAEKAPRFEGLDPRDRRPVREVTLDDARRPSPGLRPPSPASGRGDEPKCPPRVPSQDDVAGNVVYLDTFRKNGGGGGSRIRTVGTRGRSLERWFQRETAFSTVPGLSRCAGLAAPTGGWWNTSGTVSLWE